MPTTRRKSHNAASSTAKTPAQSTLSFNNKSARISKPSVQDVTTSGKKASSKLLDAKIVDEISVIKPDTPTHTETVKNEVDQQDKTAEQKEEEIDSPAPKPKRRIAGTSKPIGQKSPRELSAEKITDAQIKKYWKVEEDSRLAPRVHQSHLPLHEKILRHFDLSSQYGPCIGIPRLNRWKRADLLGLDPPVEVLAVLLRENDKKTAQGCGKGAYIDELGSGRVVLVE